MDCNASINALVQGKNLQETLNRLRADTSCFRDFPLNQSIAREEMREASEASKGIVFHQENSWKMMAVFLFKANGWIRLAYWEIRESPRKKIT